MGRLAAATAGKGSGRMKVRSVGLDIGSFAVRAAAVSSDGGKVTVERFGQVTLPVGAVVAGEVQAPEVVGAAIRRLWHETKMPRRRVVLGVSSTRVILRQTDLPSMPLSELKAAVGFQAGELIPLPLDEAYLDFEVMGDAVDEEGLSRTRILLAAAHKSVVDSAVAAAHAGGVHPGMVDPTPLAMLRVLGPPSPDVIPDVAQAEAVVAMGAGLTALVVHHDGAARFVRLSSHGGDEVTERIATQLGLSSDAAEDAKRRTAAGGSASPPGTGAVVAAGAAALAREVQSSIEFYTAQPGALPISRVVLTGGAARTAGLSEALSSALGVPVEMGHMPPHMVSRPVGFSDDLVRYVEPLVAVPVGLALAAMPGRKAPLNLLPPAVAGRRRERVEMAAIGSVLTLTAAGLLLAWSVQGGRLAHQRSVLASQQAGVSSLQGKVDALSYVSATQARIAKQSGLVTTALQGSVDWVQVLSQISSAMPADTWLTSFQGHAPSGTSPGTVTLAAQGAGQLSTASWLNDLSTVPSLSSVFVTSSSRSAVGQPVAIASIANLTPAASPDRSQQYLGNG